MITTADLRKVKDTLIEGMKTNFKNDGNIFPVVIVIGPSGSLTPIPTPYRTHEEKAFMMNIVRVICKKTDAIAVAVITEAWIKTVNKEDSKKFMEEMKASGKTVSDYGDKKEVAVIMFETKLTGETITFDMDRDNNKLINKISATTTGGDFANILSPALSEN
jgi:hypothetical protein